MISLINWPRDSDALRSTPFWPVKQTLSNSLSSARKSFSGELSGFSLSTRQVCAFVEHSLGAACTNPVVQMLDGGADGIAL